MKNIDHNEIEIKLSRSVDGRARKPQGLDGLLRLALRLWVEGPSVGLRS